MALVVFFLLGYLSTILILYFFNSVLLVTVYMYACPFFISLKLAISIVSFLGDVDV